jgi:myosin heavy subunit
MQAAVAGLRASALALVTPAAHHAAAPPSSPVAGLVASCRAGRSSRKHQGHVRRGRTTRRHSPDTGRDSSIDSRHGQESGDRGRGIDAGAVCCSCAKRSSRASRGANSHARPRVELSSSTTVMTTTRSGGTGATTTTIATKTTSVRVRVLQGREGAAAHRQHYSQYLRVRTGAPASSSGGLASSLSALMDDLLLSADEQAEFLCEFDSHHEHAQDIEVEEFEERHYEEAEEEERAFAHQDAALALQLHELAARCALSHAQQQRERASAHELAALRTQAQALREQQALLAQQKAQLEQQLAQEKQALTAAQAQVHALDVAALGSALRGMGV